MYYWENYLNEDRVREILNGDGNVYDCRQAPPVSDSMLKAYPTYVERPYCVFQNGFCVGYTDEATFLKFKGEGVSK